MTSIQLSNLRLLAADEWNISSADRESVAAILAEREAVLQLCRTKADSGSNAGAYELALAILRIAGERPEGEENRG